MKSLITRSKNRAWQELIDAVEDDVWGLPYKVVMGKLRARPPKIPADVLHEITEGLFPSQEWRGGNHPVGGPEDFPEITVEEVVEAGARLASGKAPGPDGVPPGVVKLLITRRPEVFRGLADRLLRSGRFPDIWKRAHLVLIPKGGAGKYRPICLLDTAGKVLENILVARLHKELEELQALSDSQYGFRKGCSTFGALGRVMKAAGEERAKRPKKGHLFS